MPFFKRKSAKKKKGVKSIYKYQTPKDVKESYIMPILLFLGIFLIVLSLALDRSVTSNYQKKVMASAMKYNEELAIYNGDKNSKGTLTLGHTILSKDGKTLAAEIKYDQTAHENLSSFGSRYRLRLVKRRDNKKNYQLSYGLFGTDGSGVLQIHSNNGFNNQSIIVMIIDAGQLVSSDSLGTDSQVKDTDIDKSITAQLSDNSGGDSSPDLHKESKKLPPIYYVRLNALNAKKSNRNWTNDSQLVRDLFIKDNLKKYKKVQEKNEKKLNNGYRTLHEMNMRLKENPKDETAQQNRENLKGDINSLKQEIKKDRNNYKLLKNSSFSKKILDPKQTKYHLFKVHDLRQVDEQKG